MKSQHALHSSLKGPIYKNGDKKSNLVCPGFFLLKDFVFLIAKTSFNLLQKKIMHNNHTKFDIMDCTMINKNLIFVWGYCISLRMRPCSNEV